MEIDETYDLDSPLLEIPRTQQGVESLEAEPVLEDTRRKTVKPVFEASRLLSGVGLPKLRTTLLKTKFGRKEPRKDLQKLAAVYELWAHRLMPRSNVDDIASLLLKAGEDYQVKAYRKEQLDEDKYGGIAAGVGVRGGEGEGARGGEGGGVDEGARESTREGAPAPAPAPTLDSDSDLEIPILRNDIPEEEDVHAHEDPSAADEWAVYRDLGF